MDLSSLGKLLQTAPQYRGLKESLATSPADVRLQVLADASPFALSALWRDLQTPLLVIAPKPEDSRRLYEQIAVWSDDDNGVIHLPETETLPFERLASDADTIHQRLRTMVRLADRTGPPPLVVASTVAVAQKTLDRGTFDSGVQTLRKDDNVDLEEILDLWRRLGYRMEAVADTPGLVSRRGGILDIFPVGSESPSRIELWGDQIDSIRLYDPSTQRSTSLVDSVTVIPAQETLPGLANRGDLERRFANIDLSSCSSTVRERIAEEIETLLDGREVEDIDFYSGFLNQGSFLDYFPDDAVLVLHRPPEIVEAAWSSDERATELREVKERRGELPPQWASSHMLWSQVEEARRRFRRRLEVTPWGAQELTHDTSFSLPLVAASGYFGRMESFVNDVRELVQEGHRVVAVTSAPKRLTEIVEGYGLAVSPSGPSGETPQEGSITLIQASGAGLNDGFELAVDGRKLVVYSDAEIFGVAKQRRPTRRRSPKRDAFLSELVPGDYVVHVEHGIGRFTGTGRTSRDEGDREYLILQYAQGDKLYVPVDHLDRVGPYIAPMDRAPHLTRLGTQEWRRTKERVERSTREMASELISLYASRELAEGHSFAVDTPWQVELEDSFPYEETPDQNMTIADVKADMENIRPMDRLVCGDVGYGKTEIALRAAFKAVMDGKQVAVLVPTTVLAQQHYVTFSQRLAPYPVNVEVLSRFRSDREQRAVVEGLADGSVDICIGTHRLIQRDVRFKDVGLIVVDEEQRFGVAHKERLKQMRHQVEVLTLTATPIPRTLHLSLAGVRDMSTIDTPPEERLPIKTYVSEFSDELIQEALRRELDRQGQVFFLHNRVHNIDYMAGYIRDMVPEATVAVAHGQMPEDQLEQTMVDFAEGKMDVLVCTTIIESGLDIPNVNSLIINRADTFGLAQLYQLRGRVGRGARRAFTYLLVPPHRSITEQAEKRLKTMLAATELGAGFRIAMKDLEIRGAGNILGAEQSGHIHAVGFDLYTRMLSEAVEGMRAQREGDASGSAGEESDVPTTETNGEAKTPASVDLGIPANIPHSYVSDLPTRLGIYRRMMSMSAMDDINSMSEELLDRFGPLPWQVENLLYVVTLKLTAGFAGVSVITKENGQIVIRLNEEVGGARGPLQRLMPPGASVGHMQIRADLEAFPDGWEAPLTQIVETLSDFRQRMTAAAELQHAVVP